MKDTKCKLIGKWMMSMFNKQMICMKCKVEEETGPDYEDAVKAEIEACKAGNYNF